LEKKLYNKQIRHRSVDFDACQDLQLDPKYSKVYGFPDNSAVLDPDYSIISSSNDLYKKPATPS
jgi:hypothetical protein